MNSNNEQLIYAFFGIGFVLAGLQAIFTREIKFPRRQVWERRYSLEGPAASYLGVVFLLWGIVLCTNARQIYLNLFPTLFEMLMKSLRMNEDRGIFVLLLVNFSMFALPYFVWWFTSRE